MPIKAVFRLVNFESEDPHNLESDEYLKFLVENAVQLLNGSHPLSVINDDISKDVFKYLKLQDQWVCFGSTLLKSVLFHETRLEGAIPNTGTNGTYLPIIRLDRSKSGKPYLPNTNRQLSFSVSHQYPFVGISWIEPEKYDGIDIGLDIVNFEDYRKQSISVDEYLGYFKEMFTTVEWNQILGDLDGKGFKSDRYKIRNFYIRWAMKEAVSKAKGLGLSMDFSTFQILIEGFDDSDTILTTAYSKEQNSLEDLVSTPNKKCIIGKLEKLGEPIEYWLLSFTSVSSTTTFDILGCACISVGPFSEKPDIDLDIIHQSFSLTDLISSHATLNTRDLV